MIDAGWAFALFATIVAVLALFAWAGASTRAATLEGHLNDARRLLRRERERKRVSAEIIPFPVLSAVEGPSHPDNAA